MRTYLCAFAAALLMAAGARAGDSRSELAVRTDPPGATVLVIPAKPGAAVFRCTAPCTVQVPLKWGFRIVAIKEGYRMVAPGPQVRWVSKGRAWWQSQELVLEPSTAEIELRPVE